MSLCTPSHLLWCLEKSICAPSLRIHTLHFDRQHQGNGNEADQWLHGAEQESRRCKKRVRPEMKSAGLLKAKPGEDWSVPYAPDDDERPRVEDHGNLEQFMCFISCLLNVPSMDHLVGLVVRRPPREWQTWTWFPFSPRIFSQVELYQWIKNWYAPGIIGSALELVGSMSAYCDWVLFLSQCGSWHIVCTDPSLRYTSILLGH